MRPLVRSGKLGTPWERMQVENSSVLLLLASALWPPDEFVAVVLGVDEPHAARPKAAASRLRMIVNRMARPVNEIGGKPGETVALGLQREGMAVDVALDGAEGLRKALVYDYDVIVLDRDLPGLHGDRVCERLVNSDAHPPRARGLMLTG